MIHGGTQDNVLHKSMLRKKLSEDFRCVMCPPHGGENWRVTGRKDGRWVDIVGIDSHGEFSSYNRKFVLAKPKHKK